MATNYAELDKNNQVIQAAIKLAAESAAKGDSAGVTSSNRIAEAERAKSGYSGGVTGVNYTSLESPAYGQMSTEALGTQPAAGQSYMAASSPDLVNEAYNNYIDAQIAQATKAYKSGVAGLDKQKEKIQPYYYDAMNAAAANQAEAQRAYNEFSNAQGINVGANAQALLNRNTDYQNSLNQINVAKANAYSDIEAQRQQLSIEYEAAKADARATGDFQRLQALQEAQRYQDEMLYEQQMAQLQAQSEADQMAYDQALRQADTMAKYGVFSGYEALGYSPEEIAAMQSGYTPSGSRSGSSGGSGGGNGDEQGIISTSDPLYKNANAILSRGNTDATKYSAIEYLVQYAEDDTIDQYIALLGLQTEWNNYVLYGGPPPKLPDRSPAAREARDVGVRQSYSARTPAN